MENHFLPATGLRTEQGKFSSTERSIVKDDMRLVPWCGQRGGVLKEALPVTRAFFPFLAESDWGEVCFFLMAGVFMEPMIGDRSLCPLHQGKQCLEDNKLYLFGCEGEVYVRRVCITPGVVQLRCDNRGYEHYDFIFSDSVEVYGQVIWVSSAI